MKSQKEERDQVSVNLHIKIMKTSMKIRGILLVFEVTAFYHSQLSKTLGYESALTLKL